MLENAGLSPRQMGKNEWSAEQPLRAIRRVIDQCSGTVVIAFTRYEFATGRELQKDGTSKQLEEIRLPTVWNQIEAAMAYTRDIPLLVIAENGLRDDGLLEGRYDWKVFWTDFSRTQIESPEFAGYLRSWKELVTAASRRKVSDGPDISSEPIGRLLARLTVPQLWKLATAIAALLVSAVTLGYSFGIGKWPWK